LGVGIGDLKAFSAERFNKIDCRAAHQIKTDRIDDQFCLTRFGDDIIGFDRIGQTETVLKSTTVQIVVEFGLTAAN